MLFSKKSFQLRLYLLQHCDFTLPKFSFHGSSLYSSALLLGRIVLSTQEITDILRANEYSHDFQKENYAVKYYDSNQLPSNSPIEDTRTEVRCLLTTGTMIGVFDGHEGPACAQVLAKRLPKYVSAGLLPRDLLEKYFHSFQEDESISLIEGYNEKYELLPELEKLHHESFSQYIRNLLSSREEVFSIENVLEKAVLTFDEDISTEALRTNEVEPNPKTISIAMSGSVACLAHIDGPHLHVANVGDCRAVLGICTEDDTWVAKELTIDHNSDNTHEVLRIRNEHPPNEANTVIQNCRLLGELAPFRAVGDVRYKWSKEKLMKTAVPVYGHYSIASNYHTPPYLSAKPEVSYHRLAPCDKFLIIASDGLWDIATPQQAVRLVGEHMRGKLVLNPFKVPKDDIQLKQLNELLLKRKECFNMKPVDGNAATHLLRNVLGRLNYASERDNLSHILTLPQGVVRWYRDDITITVVFFDSEYLRQIYA